MSRSLQDQFIDDDEDETCPLCVEEFDLTDKGFRPCPCGYQICQFCYHNVKTNMNGLCPACRRPYNDADIEYKVITPEETALHKARQAQRQKKTQQALQKEKQKAEADNLSRKHLAGMRVVQKNLVYVTGLSPTSQEDQLLQTLRGDQYFGQYGKIIKIVVSKAKDPSHPHSVGVYVTYERKEDAASCIAAVDGSKNGDRTLRAQFGTTKYCSAYLRGENCTNRNCMFLHEPGEANESYSRADLSALNAGSSQQGVERPSPPQSQQPLASAAPQMAQQTSNDRPSSPTPDRPALPSTASWASKPPQSSRAESRSTSATFESPAPMHSTLAIAHQEPADDTDSQPQEDVSETAASALYLPVLHRRPQASPLIAFFKDFNLEDFRLVWSSSCLSQADQEIIKNYPPLFDPNGGARRRQGRERSEEQRPMEQEAQAFQQSEDLEQEDNPEMSGSLQLGGEPEGRTSAGQVPTAIHPPGQEGGLDQRFQYPGTVSSPGISDRGLTPQQHQQLFLQQTKPTAQGAYMNNASQPQILNPTFQQQTHPPPGHQRNVSRYSFANDTASASAAIKPVANSKLMNQQSSMMSTTATNHFGAQHQQPHSQFYTSNVQGPPPGLKTTGTPPVSGNLTFGQGHGFATGGLQYGAGSNRNQQDSYYRELLRGGDGTANRADPKREFNSLPSYTTTHPNAAFTASQSNAYPTPSYANLGAFGDGEKQRKKKGKKHRHANTSSSSGGGMVDVPDPGASHLLQQSRLHQGAGGFGGAAFTGQTVNAAAHDAGFPPLKPPAPQHSAASRIALDASRRSTPPVPPGFEPHVANETRRSTPTVPPGLPPPIVLPDFERASSRPTSRSCSRAGPRRQPSQVLPALPLRPATPHGVATSTRLEFDDEVDGHGADETPTESSRTHVSDGLKVAAPGAEGGNVSSGVDEDWEGEATIRQSLHSYDLGVTEPKSIEIEASASATAPISPKSKTSTLPGVQPVSKSTATMQPRESVVSSKSDVNTRRKHLASLDITAAVTKREPSSVLSTPVDIGAPTKHSRTWSTAAPTLPLKPSESTTTSPAVKAAPRTLRVVQTAKVEPSTVAEPPISSMAAAVTRRQPSRQPSVASINPPGTPSSEHVSNSDNISMTSTSLSRANSPPPAGSKVGSAPLRSKTKSQQKKDRQERAKAIEEEKAKLEEASRMVEESTVEAIVSRKKKAKKDKEPKPPKTRPVADTTPTVSRPPSPGDALEPEVLARTNISPVKESKSAMPLVGTSTPQPPTVFASNEPSPPATPTLTPAQLISELKASAPEIQKCIDNLFRVSNSHHIKTHHNVSQKELLNAWNMDVSINPSKEQVEALLSGKVDSTSFGGEDGRTFDRHLITPSGAHLRALTKELEARFLELEKALRDMPEELRFRPSKPHNEIKLPAIDLEALQRQYDNAGGRTANVMEQMVQDVSAMKKGAFLVDEASKYINEFVMPPVTPPPSTGGPARGQHGAQTTKSLEQVVPMVEVAERQLNEAKRMADERENALKKMIKKHKKLIGIN